MSTSGGFNESDINAFAVRPLGLPSESLVVITVTPVTKCPITRRSSCESMVIFLSIVLKQFKEVAERASPCQCAAYLLHWPGRLRAENVKRLKRRRRLLMAVQQHNAESSLDRYIAEVRAAWGDGKDPQLPFKVAALMEKLFASTSPDDPWMAELIREGKPSRELYRDPDLGFIQMGHIHKQGHGNKPHDHGP